MDMLPPDRIGENVAESTTPEQTEVTPARGYNFAKRKKNKSLYKKKGKNQKQSSTFAMYRDAMDNEAMADTGTDNPAVDDAPGGGDALADMELEESSPNEIYPTNCTIDYVKSVDNWKEARAIKALENKVGKEVKKREAAEKRAGAERSKRVKVVKTLNNQLKQQTKERRAAEKKGSSASQKLKQSEHERMMEKAVTRQLLEEGNKEAEALMEESMEAMEQARQEKFAALELISGADKQWQEKLRGERRHSSSIRAKAESVHQSKLDKDRQGYNALVEHLKQKHDRANDRMKL
jgi:hypothetical protein